MSMELNFTSPPLPPIITKLAMISRFTNAEFVGIVTAKKSDPSIEAWYDTFYAANEVFLADPRTVDGVNFLVNKGLLTQDRANEILNAPVRPEERPIPPSITQRG